MIRAYRLYTGTDGNSHVIPGAVNGGKLVDAESIHFKETAAHSTFDWHNDPSPQYLITLSGVLEFTTVGGETFTIRPGDVLRAEDHRFIPSATIYKSLKLILSGIWSHPPGPNRRPADYEFQHHQLCY
jgi:hypothetical protein